MDQDVSLLCTGDLHLGRRPSRIPTDLDDSRFSPSAAWHATVEAAIDRDVDAVVVTGDVVDERNKYFEAVGPFERGARDLAEAGVPLVLVAGNHDYDVLPRIAADLDVDSAHFLGDDGTWDAWTLRRDGRPVVRFHGWSFPSDLVYESPLEEFEPAPTEGEDVPSVGVVHADLGVPDSTYAPVSFADLQATPVDAWLLGHIHEPGIRNDGDPLVLYPGSPQPLDPGEAGAHGPWLVEIDATGQVAAEQLAHATLRYESIAVDASEATTPEDVRPLAAGRIDEYVHGGVETGPLDLLLARVRLTGRTEAHRDVVDRQETIASELTLQVGSLPVRVTDLAVETRPAVDLTARAETDDLVGYLADLLRALEAEDQDEAVAPLLDEAQAAMTRTYEASAYKHLRGEAGVDRPDETAARDELERQARVLLDELVGQTEAP